MSFCHHRSALQSKQLNILAFPIRSRNESNLRVGKESGAMALALVLWSYAQDVRQRPHTRQATDACAWISLGRHWNGSGLRAQEKDFVALHSDWKSTDRMASRLSVLS